MKFKALIGVFPRYLELHVTGFYKDQAWVVAQGGFHTGCHGFWPVMTSNCWSSARKVDGVLLSRKRSMQRSVTTAIYRKCKFQHPRFTTPSRAASTSSGPWDYILSKCCNDGKSLAAYGTWTFPVLISARPRPEKLWALLSQFEYVWMRHSVHMLTPAIKLG